MTLVAHTSAPSRLPTIVFLERVYTVWDLPKPSEFKRWVPSRIELFVRAVSGGLLTVQEFCMKYQVSQQEFTLWQSRLHARGRSGLTLKMRPVLRSEEHKPQTLELLGEPTPSTEVANELIIIGDVKVDAETRTVSARDQNIWLQPQEWDVLYLLLKHRGITVSRDMICDVLYEGRSDVSLKTIDVVVCRIRRKLFRNTGIENFIETVWGRGYIIR